MFATGLEMHQIVEVANANFLPLIWLAFTHEIKAL